MLYKRFENVKLTWPSNENEVKTLTSEQVDWLQLMRIDHVKYAYKCQACSEKNLSDKTVKAPLAHSFDSASIIAHTIHQKFNLKVPNYCQEEDCNNLGLPIIRKESVNWHIKFNHFEPLYHLLREKLLDLLIWQV
ncbi:hypothetical protein ABPH35_09520 [Streptococcus sp. ZJ93]